MAENKLGVAALFCFFSWPNGERERESVSVFVLSVNEL